jgi:arylsulfatase A-like enzyme
MQTRRVDGVTEAASNRRFSRRTALQGLGAAGLAMASGTRPGLAAPMVLRQGDRQPNILVILVDEMRDWQWFPDQAVMNAYFPNLARLQQGAVRFGRYYTASNMCTPARGCLLTGLHSHQTGLMLTQGGNVQTLTGGEEATPEAVVFPPPQPPLDPRFPTWGSLLRTQGYETWWFGKWHLNDADCSLEPYGFAGGTCPSPNGGPGEGLTQDPLIADQAIEWIESNAANGPWCTTVSFVNPHDIQWYPRQSRQVDGENNPPPMFRELPPNWETPDEFVARNKPRLQLVSEMALPQVFGALPHRGPGFERGWLQMQDLYFQLHSYLDTQVGRVLDALEAQPEVAENTIILFTSDHGDYVGSHGLRGKGAGLYEEGIRVPLWVKDMTGHYAARPDVIRTQLSSSVDITPLLLTIAAGGDSWRSQPDAAHLANRFDLSTVLRDPAAPGQPFVLHATDEDGFEYGPRLFPFLQDAPFHIVGLITGDAKLGVYSDWADGSTDLIVDTQEIEFYDYTTASGRLELENSAVSGNTRFEELYGLLMTDALPNTLRAPLPDPLEEARLATTTATLERIAYDRSTAREDEATPTA